METSSPLSFSGTSYLGINRNIDFQSLVQRGIDSYGLHYGGSRFSNLCPDIYEQAEATLCQISGAEAALIVSSGTVAGHLATSLIPASSKIYIAPDSCILADAATIRQIKTLPIFGGGAPPPPAYLYAFVKGQEIYTQARLRLQKNIAFFKKEIEHLKLFRFIDKYPVFYTAKNELAVELLKQQIILSSFRYPTPESDLISRVVLNSNHQQSDLAYLVQEIKSLSFDIK